MIFLLIISVALGFMVCIHFVAMTLIKLIITTLK